MAFELWETESRNLAGVYDTEAAAFAAIREVISLRGRDAVRTFALVRGKPGGNVESIASGTALMDLALKTVHRSTRAAS